MFKNILLIISALSLMLLLPSSSLANYKDQEVQGNATINVTFSSDGKTAYYSSDKGLSNYTVTFCDGTEIDIESVGGDNKTFTFGPYNKIIKEVRAKAGTSNLFFQSNKCLDAQPKLEIDKTTSNTTVNPGSSVEFTITVKNVGSATAYNVQICDYPSGDWDSMLSGPNALTYTVNTLDKCWNAGNLSAGSSKSYKITLKLDSDCKNASNYVKAWANDVSKVEKTVNLQCVDAKAKLNIIKKADKKVVKQGSEVGFTIVVKNIGNVKAENVKVCDIPSSSWSTVKSGPSLLAYTSNSLNKCWTVGDLNPGSEKTYRIVLKLKSTACKPASNYVKAWANNASKVSDTETVKICITNSPHNNANGYSNNNQGGDSNGEHLNIQKVETHVDLEAGETKTLTLNCPASMIITDAYPRIDAVDQGTGFLNDVEFLSGYSISKSSYQFTLSNKALGRAQTKLFGVCLGDKTVQQQHSINVSNPVSVTKHLGVGRHTVELKCSNRQTPISPGYHLQGGKARLYYSEPLPNGGWKLGLDVTEETTATLSIRCLDIATGLKNNQIHYLALSHKVLEVSIKPGVNEFEVSCHDQAKGIVATFNIPDRAVLIGHDPRPKTRVFKIYNPTNQVLNGEVDLVCLGDRTTKSYKQVICDEKSSKKSKKYKSKKS